MPMSVFAYYGGKNYMLKTLLPLIDSIDGVTCYVEPFFGSGKVFFNKRPHKSECVNDKSGNIVTFFRVLQDEEKYSRMMRMLENTPYAREEYERAREILLRRNKGEEFEDHLVAWAVFTHYTLCFGGKTEKTYGFQNYRDDARRFGNAISKMGYFKERVKNAVIENMDALKLIRKKCYNSPTVLLYLDPPYPLGTRKSKDEYVSEMTDEQHAEMLRQCAEMDANIIISSYDNELYNDMLLPNGFDCHYLDTTCSIATGKDNYRREAIYHKIVSGTRTLIAVSGKNSENTVENEDCLLYDLMQKGSEP